MNRFHHLGLSLFALAVLGCAQDDPPVAAPDATVDVGHDSSHDRDGDTSDGGEVGPDVGDFGRADEFIVVTFNTGTGPGAQHDEPPDDGYSSADADVTDEWYGNGLNWPPLIEDTRAWFDALQPHVVVFQEMFWIAECAAIPPEFHAGFVCEGWTMGDPSVAQRVLGPQYQVVCHPGKPDKCAAVRSDFGRFVGCDDDFCLEGMRGFPVADCGGGARVASVEIARTDGSRFTLVNFHGSSGFTGSDIDCRVQQVEQVFVDAGDGEPAANGAANLVMGDLNTDPGRATVNDASAVRWNDFVGDAEAFGWVTEVGPRAIQTYGPLSIDHVASDVFTGSCWHAGVTPQTEPVSTMTYFDHRPAVCVVGP